MKNHTRETEESKERGLYKTKGLRSGDRAPKRSKPDYDTDWKKFSFHCYHVPGTWILDECEFYNEWYLFCIEGNTRY